MKHALYPLVKWGARISIVAMIFLPALLYSIFRWGMICYSPAREAHDDLLQLLMHHPVTPVLLKLGIITVSILVSFIEVDMAHGQQASDRIRSCVRALFSIPYFAVPMIVYGVYFLTDDSPWNSPLNALALIPMFWFIGLLFIPDPDNEERWS